MTNGIAHRRWLNQANPGLASLVTELIGDGYVYDAAELKKLMAIKNDPAVLEKLKKIKLENKKAPGRLCEAAKRSGDRSQFHL